MGFGGRGRHAKDDELKRAELDLASDIAEGRLEHFGAGMSIDDALARLRGDAGSRFANDGIIWDVAAFDDSGEALLVSQVLNRHGIRCGVYHHRLVFRHADIARILGDLGLSGAPTQEDAPAEDEAGEKTGEEAEPEGKAGDRPAPAAPAAATPARRPSPRAQRGPQPSFRTGGAPMRSALLAENEEAVEAIRARAAVDSAPAPRPALTDDERSELLERIASLRDERDVPQLSSPLRVPESLSHLLGFNAPAAPRTFAGRVVKICLQLLLIYAVCLAGERIADMIPVGVPGNIVSMGLLLAFLLSGIIRMESIALAADFLLDHMAVFFIPAAVAIMGSFDLIAPNLLKLLFVCLVTTVLVFFVTSFTVSTVMNLMARSAAAKAPAPAAEAPAASTSPSDTPSREA